MHFLFLCDTEYRDEFAKKEAETGSPGFEYGISSSDPNSSPNHHEILLKSLYVLKAFL